MKNLYVLDQKLNLEEIFTNEEIKLLKKTFPKINILIRASPIYLNQSPNLTSKTKSTQQDYSKEKIFVFKRYYYKLILDDTKNKYEQEGNSIMSKSISCLIEDLFSEDNLYNNINKNNSNTVFIFTDDNQKNGKLYMHKKKQMSMASLQDKKLSENNSEILPISIEMDRNNKKSKEVKPNSKNNFDYIKKLKSPNSHYKNIYYYNIINSKKIINNNNFKNEENRNSKRLKDKKFIGKNDFHFNQNNYSINFHNNFNKLNHSNMTYFNLKQDKPHNYSNYISSVQIYNQTELNKNNKTSLNIKSSNQTTQNSLIDNYNNTQKKKRENYKNYSSKNLSKKIKSVKFLVKHITSKKNEIQKNKSVNKTPIQIKNVNICTDINIENVFNIKKYSFMNVDANLFNNIENQNYDIFILNKSVGRENILPVIGYYIFNRLGFYNILRYNKFENWCRKIADGYIRTNPYHTDFHAADITHTCLIYLKVGKVNKICQFSKNSKCALFLSCICHDYKHPGVNNNYLKETRNKVAIKYNDISILENMHIAQTFKLINNPTNEYNIFQDLDNNTYKQFRKEMISCVLSTDMSFHNVYVDFLKKCIEKKNNSSNENNNNDNNKKEDNEVYQKYMNVLIHSADISNPTKPFDIYFKWAELVVKEFYQQGDKEKELNMPCSCDRNKVTIYQSQLGFINFIEIPYFSLFVENFVNLKFYMDNLNNNKQKLLTMQENENKQKEKKEGNK